MLAPKRKHGYRYMDTPSLPLLKLARASLCFILPLLAFPAPELISFFLLSSLLFLQVLCDFCPVDLPPLFLSSLSLSNLLVSKRSELLHEVAGPLLFSTQDNGTLLQVRLLLARPHLGDLGFEREVSC
ncbi:hypothetical protein H113_03634 [Trichophyton rubrum MR1459]|uniref:Uncharacterized protein n=1 Tax=Trichophyton rubrum (strain ATCC MYA-4607 / CBS 118892) TaxID=559305 RepID=A0A080WJR7_TRIRC|nr:uncharacterized protein TERG_12210 [Trichophyton rubrum CBS 118892]EZF96132.1 hypothetical protein H113_03634 [Trichophyton rubrum MR1459]KFL61779.1 hypothetical protein TERG_12210 [Trichophyton rubrum CBS 118892]